MGKVAHFQFLVVAAMMITTTTKTLLIFASRTSTDAVTGFGGSAKKAIGVRMMGNMVSDMLEKFNAIQQQ